MNQLIRLDKTRFLKYRDDPVGFGEQILGDIYTDDVKRVMESVRDNEVTIAVSANGVGKSLPVDTPVLTPSGYKRIGDIRTGDFVFSRSGLKTKVLGVYPQGPQPTYEVGFNDGVSLLCSEDHLWAARSASDKYRGKPYRIYTAKELAGILHRFMHIPVCRPVRFSRKKLPVNPYLLGCILGDGSLTEKVELDLPDKYIRDKVSRVLRPLNVRVVYYSKTRYGLTTPAGNSNPLLEALGKLGLRGRTSASKFIPSVYTQGDVGQRKQLLAGLLDTDGYVSKEGAVVFTTISRDLANDVQHLVRSLGGICSCNKYPSRYKKDGKFVECRDHFDVYIRTTFNPFTLPRKVERFVPEEDRQRKVHRLIKSINPAGIHESVCIKVDSDDGLFLADKCIVTHNTHVAGRIVWWYYATRDLVQIYTAAAPPEDNLRRLLWGEIGSVLAKNPELGEDNKIASLHIERAPQQFITGVTIPTSGDAKTREAKFSGKHAPYLMFVFDEGDAIPDEVYAGRESCTSGGEFRTLIMFNPRAPRGEAYRMIRDGRANVVEMSAFRHPNVVTGCDQIPGAVNRNTTVRRIHQMCRPMDDKEVRESDLTGTFVLPCYLEGATAIDQKGQQMPPLKAGHYKVMVPAFSHMVLGKYPAQAEDQLIDMAWINAARSRWDLYVSQYGEVIPPQVRGVAGVDPGEFGQDATALVMRFGGWVPMPQQWHGVDVLITADNTKQRIAGKPIDCVNVDGNGVGAGTAPMLERYGVTAQSIKTQETKFKDEAYYDSSNTELGEFKIFRDCILWMVREWLRADPGSMLPPDEELIEELRVLTYRIDGKYIRIMDKDTLKELLKRSPNKLDALALTFPRPKKAVGANLVDAERHKQLKKKYSRYG